MVVILSEAKDLNRLEWLLPSIQAGAATGSLRFFAALRMTLALVWLG